MSKIEKIKNLEKIKNKPTKEEAKEAVKTLIKWAGDDPTREGLLETPNRVTRSYQDFFSGYDEDPREILSKKFREVEGYDEMIVLVDSVFTTNAPDNTEKCRFISSGDSGVYKCLEKLFELKFGTGNISYIIPKYWLPNWCGDVKEPSARVLSVYNKNNNKSNSIKVSYNY